MTLSAVDQEGRGMRRVALVAGVAALVMGCAGPMGTPRPGPSVRADQVEAANQTLPPTTEFDGSYHINSLHVVSSFGSAQNTTWCDSPGQPLIVVQNGQFSYQVPHPNLPGNPTPVYPAVVAADGLFAGQVIQGSIYGQIRDGYIQGRIDGSACVYTFAGNRTSASRAGSRAVRG
jgi:hypothetical protein